MNVSDETEKIDASEPKRNTIQQDENVFRLVFELLQPRNSSTFSPFFFLSSFLPIYPRAFRRLRCNSDSSSPLCLTQMNIPNPLPLHLPTIPKSIDLRRFNGYEEISITNLLANDPRFSLDLTDLLNSGSRTDRTVTIPLKSSIDQIVCSGRCSSPNKRSS